MKNDIRRPLAIGCFLVLLELTGYGLLEADLACPQVFSCGTVGTLTIIAQTNSVNAYQNIPYSKTFLMSGGTSCVAPQTPTWSIVSGSLPTGLALSSSLGSITGTPTGAGPSSFTLQVIDCGGAKQQIAQLATAINVWTLKSTAGISIPATLSVAINTSSAGQTATCTFSDGSTLNSPSCPVVWAITPPTTAATVSQTGSVTGVSGGTAGVVASFSGQMSNTEAVTITGGTPPSTPTILTTALPQAYLNALYPTQTLVETGGTGGCCTWAIVSGALPGGLSFSTSAGTISGTPTASGTFPITITATDGSSDVSPQQGLTLIVNTVNSPIALATSTGTTTLSLNTGQAVQLGSPVCTWSNGASSSGTGSQSAPCPSTLTYSSSATGVATVSSTGVVTAVSAGTANITATVPGCTGCTSNAVVVTVTSTTVVINNSTTLTPAQQDIVYPGEQLTATGGTPPYTYATLASSAPTGMSVSTSGLIQGTPTVSGTVSTWQIQVTDSASHSSTTTFSLTTAALLATLTISPANATISQGGTLQYTALANFSNGTTANVTTLVTPVSTPLSFGTGWKNDTGSGAASVTVTVANSAGQNLIAACRSSTAALTFSISDSASQTWTQFVGSPLNTVQTFAMFYVLNSAALTSVTGTASAGTGTVACAVFPVTNGATVTPIDGTPGTASSSSTSSLTTSSITTTNANDVLGYCWETSSQTSYTAVAPFANVVGTQDVRVGCAAEVVSAIQTGLTATENFTPGSTPANGLLFAMKGAGASTGGWSSSAPANATVNSTGLASGINAGTTTISATFQTASGSTQLTVSTVPDTALVVSPSSQSSPIGTTITYSAVGNNNPGNSYTVTVQSANAAVATTAANKATCVGAGGPITITATSGSLTGTAQLTCTTAVTQSLLAGCTYIGSGGCSAPTGWTLLVQQDFECPTTSHASPANPACATLPGGQGPLGSTSTFETAQAHSGSYGFGALYAGDGYLIGWTLATSLTWPASPPGGYHSIYVSYWDYTDPNALFANSDYYEGSLVQNAAFQIVPNCLTGWDGQIFASSSIPTSTASITTTSMLGVGVGSPTACTNNFFYQQGFQLTINAGRWEQHELLFTPATSYGAPVSTNPPNCNSLSPTTAGCGNGATGFWLNGATKENITNLNNTSDVNFTAPSLWVGGVITSFNNLNETARCPVFSATGGGSCPGTQPGTGAPPPFHRYVDDIIVIYQ
jgi:uncharacterized protein YjdB